MQMLYKSYLMSEEFEGPHGHYTLEKGLLHVNYAPKRFLLDTTWRCTWKLTLGKGLIFGERAEKCRCCAKVFSCWKSFKVHNPHDHDTQEKSLLHVNYVLKRFLVETTWTCTWNLTLGKGLISGESADKCRCCTKVFSCQKSLKVHMVTSGHNLKMHMKAYAG